MYKDKLLHISYSLWRGHPNYKYFYIDNMLNVKGAIYQGVDLKQFY